MGPVIVLFIDPVIEDKPCLPDGQKLPLVQAVIPQDAVGALVVTILPGFHGLNKLGLDAFFAQYFLNCLRDEFEAVVASYPLILMGSPNQLGIPTHCTRFNYKGAIHRVYQRFTSHVYQLRK